MKKPVTVENIRKDSMCIKFKKGKAIYHIRSQGCGSGEGKGRVQEVSGARGSPCFCLLAWEWTTWVAGMVRSQACHVL